MLNEFARKLIEMGASGQALDYLLSSYRNSTPGVRTEIAYTYDTGIQNRGGLTGGSQRGAGSRSSYRYRGPVKRGSRFERGSGIEYKAEGGEVSPEEMYGTIKSPDYPLLAKGAEIFRDVERRVKGSPAEFMLPGGGIAQVLDRYAYGEDPSGMEYAMAGLDVADVTPMGPLFAILGGVGAKSAKRIKETVDRHRATGKEGRDLWNAQEFKEKGFYDATDGKFRMEIDTSDARLKIPLRESGTTVPLGVGYETTVGQILHAPTLFREYPELQDVAVTDTALFDFFTRGSYNPETDLIRLSSGPPENVLNTLLHEMQHRVQKMEGFVPGSSRNSFLPEGFDKEHSALIRQIQATRVQLEKGFADYLGHASYDPAAKIDALDKGFKKAVDAEIVSSFPEYVRFLSEFDRKVDAGPPGGRWEARRALENQGVGFSERWNLKELFGKTMESLGDITDADIQRLMEARQEYNPVLKVFRNMEDNRIALGREDTRAYEHYMRTPGEIEARVVGETAEKNLDRSVFPYDRLMDDYADQDAVIPLQDHHLSVIPGATGPVKKANGGGIAALAPRATGMFNGPQINKGVGAYAPLTRRRA